MSATQNDSPTPQIAAMRDKYRAQLGGRDPLEVMTATPEALAEIIAGATDAELRKQPAPGKWSVCEILGHLLDSEIVTGYRLRMILSHDKPAIQGFDQNLFVENQHHNEASPAELLNGLRAMTAINVHLWRRLNDEELERYGVHSERGNESLGQLRDMYAGHGLGHIDQVRRTLAAVRSGATA